MPRSVGSHRGSEVSWSAACRTARSSARFHPVRSNWGSSRASAYSRLKAREKAASEFLENAMIREGML